MRKKPSKSVASRAQHVEVRAIEPATKNQASVFSSWKDGQHLVLLGVAGTGKTFLSLFLALKEGLASGKPIKIVRSAVPSRDMGFMPGSLAEKAQMYESPYVTICAQLLGRGDAYEILKTKGHVEFVTTSYLRGTTMDDCLIVVDEVQNMGGQEIHTIMTRVGVNTRIIFAGDVKQTDLQNRHDKSGLLDAIKVFRKMGSFDIIEFGVEDIVRSELVKEYIVARDALENQGIVEPI